MEMKRERGEGKERGRVMRGGRMVEESRERLGEARKV